MKKNLTLLVLFLMAFNLTSVGQDGWTNLFNGKDLTGWEQLNGEAKYTVEDGMIVGTTVMNTPNSFIRTEKLYTDFVFEVEYLSDTMSELLEEEQMVDEVSTEFRESCVITPSKKKLKIVIPPPIIKKPKKSPIKINPKTCKNLVFDFNYF